MSDTIKTLVEAALFHVPFDGWSEAALSAAIRDTGTDPVVARALLPRGALDLALAFHRIGDAQMVAQLDAADLSSLRFRDRIAHAVRLRLEIAAQHKEAVRRGTTLLALPMHAPDGAKALWGTADAIWTALGDSSQDVNYYTKRLTLSGVYSATVLYWLGDETPDYSATWAFLDRRIDNVMQIEKAKAGVQKNPLLKAAFSGPMWLLDQIKAPKAAADMPGRWRAK